MNDLVQELNRGLLLKAESVANRVAGIYQQSYAQRKICLGSKIANIGWRFAVVENAKVGFLQILHVVVVFVGNGEDYVHLVNRHDDVERLFLAPLALVFARSCRSLRLSRRLGLRTVVRRLHSLSQLWIEVFEHRLLRLSILYFVLRRLGLRLLNRRRSWRSLLFQSCRRSRRQAAAILSGGSNT